MVRSSVLKVPEWTINDSCIHVHHHVWRFRLMPEEASFQENRMYLPVRGERAHNRSSFTYQKQTGYGYHPGT